MSLAGVQHASGRFYNGRDHSTVIRAIQRIEALRESDPEVDGLLSDLRDQLIRSRHGGDEQPALEARDQVRNASFLTMDELADAIAERVWYRIAERLQR